MPHTNLIRIVHNLTQLSWTLNFIGTSNSKQLYCFRAKVHWCCWLFTVFSAACYLLSLASEHSVIVKTEAWELYLKICHSINLSKLHQQWPQFPCCNLRTYGQLGKKEPFLAFSHRLSKKKGKRTALSQVTYSHADVILWALKFRIKSILWLKV